MTYSYATLDWTAPSVADTGAHIVILRADRAAAIVLPYHWTGNKRAFSFASVLAERPHLQRRTERGWREVERLPLHIFAYWASWCEDQLDIPRVTLRPGDDFPQLGKAAEQAAAAAQLIADFAAGDAAEVELEPKERRLGVLARLERAARARGMTLEMRGRRRLLIRFQPLQLEEERPKRRGRREVAEEQPKRRGRRKA
ncbi:MAG TPA: hypothetical protein VFS21_19320 [Roseiflexaceae bacterium]|nr:hypothetical protein [Roseiflexaceae bacterium]